ncbi:MAG: hypothetical protein V4773_11495 [Verrucomicrobiota bacterium]
MPIQSVSNFPSPLNAWKDVTRVCRRICVLRERSDHMEASRLESGALSELIAALRMAGESEEAVGNRLAEIFAVEEERVANASVLAELLLPALTAQLSSAPAESRKGFPDTPAPLAPLRLEEAAAPRPPTTDIATFIDEMLTQETAPPRARERRAS